MIKKKKKLLKNSHFLLKQHSHRENTFLCTIDSGFKKDKLVVSVNKHNTFLM